MADFIDDAKIQKILEKNRNPSRERVLSILRRSRDLKGLTPEETAALLQCDEGPLVKAMFATAQYIKEQIYGNRLVMFAPLYVTNICRNNCLYCGFRADNKELKRKQLSMEEIRKETEMLVGQGHKRLLLVAGEDQNTSGMDYVEKTIKTVYDTRVGNGSIRRLNVNVAPLSVNDFIRLKKTGIGTYQLFQETYHHDTYKKMHPSGPKADYAWRIYAMDRAMEAGIDDVGIGALLGLYDYRFEVLAMLYHSMHLEEKFGVGPHTISVPRLKPALNAPLANDIPYPVSDHDFKKLVAIIRIAVPYTGIILSTRESAELRDGVFELGISQISAGSRTNPGAYVESCEHAPDSEQFSITDTRTQLQVIKDVIKKGFFPSFCTACYRVGRTGKDFMDFAKPGEIKNFCIPNCILTFKEYLIDYADEDLKEEGEALIEEELESIPSAAVREKTIQKLAMLEQGQRDLYF
ncbi:MAG: [FeFe] hydrogenase H-cluster radical SAM maturase HydG [Nanoarchaeota archaeon]|nr:[FeFe] hydrogenase H-cluster radical SAM maturase HydG [Nanoarchaeota archaeon]